MKKILIGICSVFLVNNLAFAKEYKDDSFESKNKIYGRVKVSVGFERHKFTDRMYNELFKIASKGTEEPSSINKVNKAPIFSIGYNMYYKMHKNIHLFAGTDFKLRFNSKVFDAVSIETTIAEVMAGVKIDDLAKANLKFGVKLIPCEYIAIETYITGGAGFLKTHVRSSENQIRLGYNAGVGADVIFNDRFFIGAEYLHMLSNAEFKINGGVFKYNAHIIVGKVGFQF